MSRDVPEWVGAHNDQPAPKRVKTRIYVRADGKCAICGRQTGSKLRHAFDHIVALINGGENRESNLQLLCVSPCHSEKTKKDVAQKSKDYRVRAKHLGITSVKRNPMPGSRASGLRKRMNGTVERRS